MRRENAPTSEGRIPAFDVVTGAPGAGRTPVMRLEHAELRRLMAELMDSLARSGEEGHVTPWAALSWAPIALTNLSPTGPRVLTVDEALGQQAPAEGAEVEVASVIPEALDDAAE